MAMRASCPQVYILDFAGSIKIILLHIMLIDCLISCLFQNETEFFLKKFTEKEALQICNQSAYYYSHFYAVSYCKIGSEVLITIFISNHALQTNQFN